MNASIYINIVPDTMTVEANFSVYIFYKVASKLKLTWN